MGHEVLKELSPELYMAFFIDHMHNNPSLETVYASLIGAELMTYEFTRDDKINSKGGGQMLLSIIGTIMDKYYQARKLQESESEKEAK